jgi:trk system potassium uptake protein TrkH
MFNSIGQSVRHSAFQVVTIITTTGYATTNFDTWPTFSKIILFFLMFIGGCAGSTGGGIKNVRILLLLKSAKRDLLKIIHPRAVYSVRYGEKSVDEKILSEVTVFFFMYIILFCLAVLVVSIEGKDIVTTLTAVAATIGNIGPGLGLVGPMGNFSSFTDLSKVVLSFCMIIGRIEIYPILLLASRRFWRK